MAASSRERFGCLDDGTEVLAFTLLAGDGARARVMSYGATLVSLELPAAFGRLEHVVLGFPTLASYLGPHPTVGAIVGRYANRIANARFELDGRRYELDANAPPHHLHGGARGFGRRVFAADDSEGDALVLRYRSPDGEEGYPGTLDVEVRYSLRARPGSVTELAIEQRARTDAPTVVSLTHHGYFNLRDAGASDVLGHVVEVPARNAYELDADGIPTGRVVEVAGSALDLRQGAPLGARIAELASRGGYDHCYALERGAAGPSVLAARVHEPTTGRTLEVFTTQPALQLYSGQALDGSLRGHRGIVYRRYAGLCLETQHPPDAPNQPGFPSARLDPGEEYCEISHYRFGRL